MTDILTVLLLVFMEGVLSFDNALALAAMVRHLPLDQQKKALTYGIFGAFGFRFAALFFLEHFIDSSIAKACGGVYLIWLSLTNLFKGIESGNERTLTVTSFIKVIILVELTDIVFSMDSILAAVAISPKLWVVITGGILGIITMRFAASIFIGLMDKFKNLETSAYVLVGIVGIKLSLESMFHVNFETGSTGFAIFWALMGTSLLYGFNRGAPVCISGK